MREKVVRGKEMRARDVAANCNPEDPHHGNKKSKVTEQLSLTVLPALKPRVLAAGEK